MNPEVAIGVNRKAIPIRPAPPPPHLRRRRPGTRSAPPSRPSAAATDGCAEHPWLAGQDSSSPSPSLSLSLSLFGSRVTGQHVRAGHHSPTNKCDRRGGRGSLALSLLWMDGALTFSLFAFACLFIPSPRSSAIHPSQLSSLSVSLSPHPYGIFCTG